MRGESSLAEPGAASAKRKEARKSGTGGKGGRRMVERRPVGRKELRSSSDAVTVYKETVPSSISHSGIDRSG